MKTNKPNFNLNLKLNYKKFIFFSKQRGKKINKKLNIYLLKKILCSYKILLPIFQKLCYKMGTLYI